MEKKREQGDDEASGSLRFFFGIHLHTFNSQRSSALHSLP